MYDKSLLVTPDVVTCCEKPIMAMRMPDDRISATLHSLCDAVQLDYIGQLQRIQRQPSLAKWLHRISVVTLVGKQEVDVLIVTAIPAWLIGIQLNRLAPEKQALILRFQDEAVDTLYRYFFKREARPDTQATPKRPPEPDGTPKEWVEADPLSSLPDEMWERQYQAMAGFEREWRTMKADIASLNAHLTKVSADLAEVKVDLAALKAALEQRPAGSAKGAARQTDDRLSPDHFLHLYVLARSLESRTGEPLGAVMRELAAAFQVMDVGELPDSAWDGVLAWFWQRSQRSL